MNTAPSVNSETNNFPLEDYSPYQRKFTRPLPVGGTPSASATVTSSQTKASTKPKNMSTPAPKRRPTTPSNQNKVTPKPSAFKARQFDSNLPKPNVHRDPNKPFQLYESRPQHNTGIHNNVQAKSVHSSMYSFAFSLNS